MSAKGVAIPFAQHALKINMEGHVAKAYEDELEDVFGDPLAPDPEPYFPSYLCVRFVTKRFVAGVITDDDGIIIEAAPILKWGMGKYFMVVHDWLKRKGQLEYINTWEVNWHDSKIQRTA